MIKIWLFVENNTLSESFFTSVNSVNIIKNFSVLNTHLTKNQSRLFEIQSSNTMGNKSDFFSAKCNKIQNDQLSKINSKMTSCNKIIKYIFCTRVIINKLLCGVFKYRLDRCGVLEEFPIKNDL